MGGGAREQCGATTTHYASFLTLGGVGGGPGRRAGTSVGATKGGRKGVKWRGLTRCGGHQDMLDVGRGAREQCGSNEGRTGSIGSLKNLTTNLVWTGGGGEALGGGSGRWEGGGGGDGVAWVGGGPGACLELI